MLVESTASAAVQPDMVLIPPPMSTPGLLSTVETTLAVTRDNGCAGQGAARMVLWPRSPSCKLHTGTWQASAYIDGSLRPITAYSNRNSCNMLWFEPPPEDTAPENKFRSRVRVCFSSQHVRTCLALNAQGHGVQGHGVQRRVEARRRTEPPPSCTPSHIPR